MTLTGKRTYIVAVVMAMASFAVGMDWLTQTQYQVILGLLGSLGLSALRSGVSQSERDTAGAIKGQPAPGPFPGIDVGTPGAPGL
jgi:hypothetical protein